MPFLRFSAVFGTLLFLILLGAALAEFVVQDGSHFVLPNKLAIALFLVPTLWAAEAWAAESSSTPPPEAAPADVK